MQRSTIDSCLFTFFDPDSISFLAIAVYVDDALIVDNDPTLRDRFVHDLSERFPTEDKGPLVWILNVAIERDRSARSLTLSQSLYVSDLLTKHGHWAGMAVSHDVDCPLEEGTTLSSVDQPTIDSPEYDDMAPRREAYMSIVGGLLWLANMTMPHLAYPRQCPDADGRPRMRSSGACAGCFRPGAWCATSAVDGKRSVMRETMSLDFGRSVGLTDRTDRLTG